MDDQRFIANAETGNKSARPGERDGRYFFLFLMLISGLLFFTMVRSFLVPVILAAVFVGLFYPLHERLLKRMGGHRGLSALICCLMLFLGILLPFYGVAHLAALEARGFYESGTGTKGWLEIKEKLEAGIQSRPVLKKLMDEGWWDSTIELVLKKGTEFLATIFNKASKQAFDLISNLFLTLFTMFYFFRDGPALLRRLQYFSPLPTAYENALVDRFLSVSNATIKCSLLIGIIKGCLGGVTFWLFGIEAPVLWGVMIALLAELPVVGAWLIMYPAALFLLLHGSVWQGVTMFLIAGFVIGSIDNLLAPFLIGRQAGMHDLLIFFSILGGLGAFGIMGFIVGPVIGAFFLTLLEIYASEHRNRDLQLTPNPAAKTARLDFDI